MINTKKFLLVLTIIAVIVLATVTSLNTILGEKEDVRGISTSSCKPYIVNVMPNIAYVGDEYYFIPSVIDCGDINYDIEVEGATWLRVVDEEYVYGIPNIGDIGTYKLELTVSNSLGSANLIEYVIVKEYE
jgi:hypothetical protein